MCSRETYFVLVVGIYFVSPRYDSSRLTGRKTSDSFYLSIYLPSIFFLSFRLFLFLSRHPPPPQTPPTPTSHLPLYLSIFLPFSFCLFVCFYSFHDTPPPTDTPPPHLPPTHPSTPPPPSSFVPFVLRSGTFYSFLPFFLWFSITFVLFFFPFVLCVFCLSVFSILLVAVTAPSCRVVFPAAQCRVKPGSPPGTHSLPTSPRR